MKMNRFLALVLIAALVIGAMTLITNRIDAQGRLSGVSSDCEEDDDADENGEMDDDEESAECEDGGDPTSATDCAPIRENATQEIAAAKLIIEYNATDADIGVHGGFDDHGWSELCVYAPDGALVLAVRPQGQLMDLTMAGIFFESREPPEDEWTFEDLKAAFPEGRYTVVGTTFEGLSLTGAATFTHDVPAQPVISSPALAEEENAGEAVAPIDGLVIRWEPVTQTIDGGDITMTGYEVIVTKVDHDDPHGFSRPTYDVHIGPELKSLTVPAEFLEPGTVYELEILAIEVSGNQTINTGFFTTN